jgi:pilus assembly protein Flp/PilA
MIELKKYAAGQGLVEYALILVLVALTLVIILSIFGSTIGETYSNIMNVI